jgi:hypothetical protein
VTTHAVYLVRDGRLASRGQRGENQRDRCRKLPLDLLEFVVGRHPRQDPRASPVPSPPITAFACERARGGGLPATIRRYCLRGPDAYTAAL